MKLHTLLSVADFERRAQALLPRAVLGYLNGGTEDGLTLQANRDALRAVQFRPKGLVGVAERSQRVTLWGRSYAHPFGIAPMGVTAMRRLAVSRIWPWPPHAMAGCWRGPRRRRAAAGHERVNEAVR